MQCIILNRRLLPIKDIWWLYRVWGFDGSIYQCEFPDFNGCIGASSGHLTLKLMFSNKVLCTVLATFFCLGFRLLSFFKSVRKTKTKTLDHAISILKF